jgi:flagellar basal-body rod protein FlgB
VSASPLRARDVADNIANQNTPGFKRQVVRFEDELASALARGELSKAAPRVEVDALSPASPDGNNVNLESELESLRENRIAYELYATLLAARGELLRASIQEGR